MDVTPPPKPKVFYGWLIVAAGGVIQFLVAALLNHSYGAYVVLVQQDTGWSKTALAGAFSLSRVETGFLGPIEGWLVDRYGPRAVVRVGLVIFGVGFMLFSQVESIVAFYALFALMVVGASLSGFLPLSVAVVNWFRRRRTTALAIMQTGYATGGLAVPLVVVMLETFGWRATAFASGIIVILVGFPVSQLVRHRPEDYGLEPDGGPARADIDGADGHHRSRTRALDFRPREALRTRAFWLISLGHGSALLVVSAMSVHLVPYLHEGLGYSLASAGLIVALTTTLQMVGHFVGGYLGDRFNKRFIAALCMGGHMAAVLLVAFATSLPAVIAFAVLHGLAWGIRGPLMNSIRAEYFGLAAFGMIAGLSSLVVTFGNTLGPLVAAILADSTGSYRAGFTVLALCAGFGSIFFIAATTPQPPTRSSESKQRLAVEPAVH